MEVKVNKEVQDFQESLFFGLSLRQFLFALLAVLVAVAVYFLLHNVVADVGWICILAAFPFAAETPSPESPHPLSAHSGNAVRAGIWGSEKCPSACWLASRNLTPRDMALSMDVSSARDAKTAKTAAAATANVFFIYV